MIFEDDETLQMYVEESLEHLSNIENDLLTIEAAGADIDADLVNSVFRAAHSIKGGAGFMGLTTIKELAHQIENVLGMVRTKEIIPNPDIISIILKAFDRLTELINDIEQSNEADIDEFVVSLIGLTTASLPEEEKDSVSNMVDIRIPDGRKIFTIAQFDIEQAKKEGKFVYLVEYDLINDIQRKGKTPLEVITSLMNTGVIMETKLDVFSVGTLDLELPNRIPFFVLFGCIIEPDVGVTIFDVDEKYVHVITDEFVSPASDEEPDGLTQALPEVAAAPQPVVSESEVAAPEPVVAPPVQPEAVSSPPPPPPPPPKPKPQPKPQPKKAPASGAKAMEVEAKSAPAQTSLRVNINLLDTLMNLAGEMVLARNQLMQAITANNERGMEIGSQRVDMVTSELQEAIMRTRMQSIANVFNKFPRVVRDLAKTLGKEVELEIKGKEVELDKTIIESINDPLTHLVRNSVDHGIEAPADRENAGKNPIGKVILKAYHEAGQVNLEIEDDGKGLDGEKLAQSAINKGLITEQAARVMSDKEKVNLIFLPGFSTAEKITDVSGRGVGMDVVKTNLDKLGGIVDIESTVGEGSIIRIKLPLTLAIIPSQIISAAKERYAIPQVNLNELLRIPANQVKERLETVGGAAVVRLRGNLLPLMNLVKVLGIEKTFTDPKSGEEYPDRRDQLADRRGSHSPLFQDEDGEGRQISDGDNPNAHLRKKGDRRYRATSAINIAVVSAGAFKYGLVVDQLRDSEEIVVKPLGRHLKSCNGYAGATIMGDGKVALILDVVGLAQMAELTSMAATDRVAEVVAEAEKAKKDRAALLLFRNAVDEQFAVPLNMVERIERIESQDIEIVGGKKVIQYRGGSLPLFGIHEVARVKSPPESSQLEVIIFMLSGKEVGLLATPPVDAVEVSVEIDSTTLKQTGILGSVIINKTTTLMVDIFEVVKTLNPEWFTGDEERKEILGQSKTWILFAEDSAFFRSQVKGFMEDEGYHVVDAEDGLIAWELLQRHADEIAIVVTDIEMPNMDGFELTTKIKGDPRFSHLPVIALTSLAADEDVAMGKKVGIDDYQLKMDREKLLAQIDYFIKQTK